MEMLFTLTPSKFETFEYEDEPLKGCQIIKQLLSSSLNWTPEDEIIVGKETGVVKEGKHFHAYYKSHYYKDREWNDALRNKIKRDIHKWFTGRVQINSSTIRSTLRTIAYTIKDGDYVTQNADWFAVMKAKAISHPKDKPYKIQIAEWYEQGNGKSDRQLVNELLSIYKHFNIPICYEKMAMMVRTNLAKNDTGAEIHFADMIMRHI